MNNSKIIEWVLRIAVFGTFFGHGMFALQGKEKWVGWVMKFGENFGGFDIATATQILFAVGVMDVMIALIVLAKPMRAILLLATIWAFWTSFMHVLPFIGNPVWDFVERWANWGAPLALLILLGWPKNWREWFK